MQARVKIEGDVLELTFTGVQESDRGRMANIEIALMKALGGYRSEPWKQWCSICCVNYRYGCEHHEQAPGYLVQLVCGDSTHKDYQAAREVLRGFALEV